MAFAAPSSTTGIQWDSLKGALLIVAPKEQVVLERTQYGDTPTPAVRADVIVVDGDQAGTRYLDTLIFPKVIQSQVKSSINPQGTGLVLGRLGQGQKKPGQSAPWTLSEATAADISAADPIGDEYLSKLAPPKFSPAAGLGDAPF